MKKHQDTRQRFSIKKFKFGAASVLIGTVFAIFAGAVQADTESTPVTEVTNEQVSIDSSSSVTAVAESAETRTETVETQAATVTSSDTVVTETSVQATELPKEESVSATEASPVTPTESVQTPSRPAPQSETGQSASQGNYAHVNKVVYLDAGHGGTDPGAGYGGVSEKNLTLALNNLVKTELENAGYTVQTTRSDDRSVALLDRSAAANKSQADLLVSIHVNASTSAAAQGIETYWYGDDANYPAKLNPTYHVDPERLKRSAYLAQSIQAATVSKTGAQNRGVLRETFAVLRETTAPAVLVEVGYLSNPTERAKLVNPSYQKELASGIVEGILSYYNQFSQTGRAAASPSLPQTTVAKPVVASSPTTSTNRLAKSGTYEFKERTGVKNEAKLSSENLAYYEAGQTVNYDSTLTAEGYNWLSYVSYSGNRRYVPVGKVASSSPTSSTPAVSTTPSTTPSPVPAKVEQVSSTTLSSLAKSGTYEFKERTGVKNEAKLSSENLAYYEAGQTVNYDSTLTAEGYNWLSYVSYSGNRRYVPVEKVASSSLTSSTPAVSTTPSTTPTPAPAKVEQVSSTTPSSLAKSGTYEFKERTGVKNEAKLSSENLAYYEAGQTVNYDSTLTAEGYNWLSYVSYSGNRRYVPVGKVASSSPDSSTPAVSTTPSTTPSPAPAKVEQVSSTAPSSLAKSGTYEFKERTGVKNEAKLSSENLAYYEAGQTVNYDSTLTAEGYNWLSYVSYSGNRRYVPVGKVASSSPTSSTPAVSTTPSTTPSPAPAKVEQVSSTAPSSLAKSGTYEFKERTGVKNEAKLSSENLAYYEAGQTVNYDSTLTAEGYNWLSYVSYSGNRRYVPVGKVASSNPVTEKVTDSSTALPKTEAKLESKDTVKTENGHTTRISYQGTGVYDVSIDNIDASKGGVKMAVWSEENDQDDIRWYELTVNDNKAQAKFNATNHLGTGRYQIHLYQGNAGNMNFLSAVSQEVKRNNFDAPYYSQRDGRWANKVYGLSNLDATGCVPAALSMVFSGLTGQDIKPTAVADYLYQETVAFNKLETGTNATGIISAAEKWNMKATALTTLGAIEEALKEGHYVLAAVQGAPFVRVYGSLSHELVLSGYKDGKTYVRDPYTPALNGWHSLANIFTQQSKFASDIVGIGKPFVKITDKL